MGRKAIFLGPQAVDLVLEPVAAAVQLNGIDVLRFYSEDDLGARYDALADASVLYAPGAARISRTLLEAAPNLRAVISIYTGTDGFDEAAATALGVVVGNGQVPENYESMAEATILLILSCLYDPKGAQTQLAPNAPAISRRAVHMLRGKTLGIVGFGQIARATAARLEPWGVNFLISTPRPRPPFPIGARVVAVDELLKESDIICVLAPLNAETSGLLNAERLARTKRGSIFINVSRGGIVDEHALYALAAQKHFSAIALDVFETEPLPKDSALRSLDNAILTPHTIGHTEETVASLISCGSESIMRVFRGELPLYVRNPDVASAWLKRWSAATS